MTFRIKDEINTVNIKYEVYRMINSQLYTMSGTTSSQLPSNEQTLFSFESLPIWLSLLSSITLRPLKRACLTILPVIAV